MSTCEVQGVNAVAQCPPMCDVGDDRWEGRGRSFRSDRWEQVGQVFPGIMALSLRRAMLAADETSSFHLVMSVSVAWLQKSIFLLPSDVEAGCRSLLIVIMIMYS